MFHVYRSSNNINSVMFIRPDNTIIFMSIGPAKTMSHVHWNPHYCIFHVHWSCNYHIFFMFIGPAKTMCNTHWTCQPHAKKRCYIQSSYEDHILCSLNLPKSCVMFIWPANIMHFVTQNCQDHVFSALILPWPCALCTRTAKTMFPVSKTWQDHVSCAADLPRPCVLCTRLCLPRLCVPGLPCPGLHNWMADRLRDAGITGPTSSQEFNFTGFINFRKSGGLSSRMSHSILTALTGLLGSTLILSLIVWFSTCVMKMGAGSRTCVPTRRASTKNSASVTGITMSTAHHLQTGTTWMT